MYTSIWNKYLPVIRIILKRALVSDQLLKIDVADFEKAGVNRKASTKFSIQSNNGKFTNTAKFPVAAKDFVAVLLNDEPVKELLLQNDFLFTLSTKYELNIRGIKKTADEESPALS